MWHKAIWKGHPMRLELTRVGLLVELANHYTTRGALMVRKTMVQSQHESYQRLKKWYLIPPCLTLSTASYVSMVKLEILGKKFRPPLHLGVVVIEKGAFESSSTTVAKLTFTYGKKIWYSSGNIWKDFPHNKREVS